MTRYWPTKTWKSVWAGVAVWAGVVQPLSRPAQAQDPVQATSYVNNPVGTLTAPPSTYYNGLVQVPNPPDNPANLLITGNVAGAKHFRAALPYTPIQDFQASLGSSYLDSFLRLSQDAGSTSSSPGVYRPYYPLSRSVTRTLPGQADVLSPISLKRMSSMSTESDIGSTIDVPPMPLKTVDAPMTLNYPLPNIGYAGDLLSLSQASDDFSVDGQLAERLSDEDILQRQALSVLFSADQEQAAERPDRAPETNTETGLLESSQPGLEAQPDLSNLSQPAEDSASAVANARVTPLQLLTRFQTQAPPDVPGFSPLESPEPANVGAAPTQDTTAGPATAAASDEGIPAWSQVTVPGTLAAYSWAHYRRFMQDAERYLKQGRFSQAIRAYKLAAIYNPHDPLAAAGRSHALFAQGEFASSALFLHRALERRPDYAEFLIDLSALMGGEETVHRRMRELERYISYSGDPALQFLLAYVSYQIGDPSRAQELIDAVQKKQPDSQAVLTLQKAIHKAL